MGTNRIGMGIAMDIRLNGEPATAADIRELREKLVPIRNKMLGPEIFDAEAAVVMSHTIAVLGDLIVEMHRDRP